MRMWPTSWIDIHNVAPRSSAKYNLEYRDEGDYMAYTDEWGIGWRSPKKDGLYYDMYSWPLEPFDTPEDIASQLHLARCRLTLIVLPVCAKRHWKPSSEGKAVVVGSLSAGVSEMHAWT